MKTHTTGFKNNIKLMGKQLDSIITYEIDGVTTTLDGDVINKVTPHFQASILKSVMKELEIDSDIEIPLKTEVNYQFGVLVNDSFEYLDYGNYIVYSCDKQEDTDSYLIKCYDKMLYSMVDYETSNIAYPITIREYIGIICSKIGLIFANENDEFANYDKQIPNELYTDLGYTYRDVLDELAEVTASTICINDDDELEIRYINDTNDTIDEEFLKDVNVNFKEYYGPINTIVFSRSAGTDNIYYPSTLPENPVEIKISDNQILNDNNRAIFLADIYEKLNGLTYYLNDFSSTGICYYDLCDKYNVQIGDTTYPCIMFNDEVNVTQGLEEITYTDRPEESETEYKYASSTDQKIDRTTLIVDKQNKRIELLAGKIVELSREITGTGSITLDNAYEGKLYYLSIKGNISLLFPTSNANLYGFSQMIRDDLYISDNTYVSSGIPYEHGILYPSSQLFGKSSKLQVDDTIYNLDFDYLNYISNDVCDEYIYENGIQKIIRRVGIDEDGNMYPLENEILEIRSNMDINVGNYSTLTLLSFPNAILYSKYLIQNEYTNEFTPRTEVISTINLSPEEIKILSRKLALEGYTTINEGFSVDLEGNMTCNNATMNDTTMHNASIIGGDVSITDTEQATSPQETRFKLHYEGDNVDVDAGISAEGVLNSGSYNEQLWNTHFGALGFNIDTYYNSLLQSANCYFDDYLHELVLRLEDTSDETYTTYISPQYVQTPRVIQTSLEERKKNFEDLENAIDLVKETDIYKYNFKGENDDDKKHIGAVIGDNFKCVDEIVSLDAKGNPIGVDTYTMLSVLWKAVKEQQNIIEKQEERISNLEEIINNDIITKESD